MQVPLRRRAQIELRLLDQDHVAADACVDERGDCTNERQPAVVGLPVVHDRRRALRLRSVAASSDVGRRFAGKKSAGGAPSRFRLSVAGGRASRKSVRPTSPPRRGRGCTRARRRRPSASAPPPRATSRPRRARSTCPTTTRRRARTPGRAELDVACAAVAVDRDAVDEGHVARLPAERVLHEEQEVRRPLAEPPHQVRVPLRAVRRGDEHLVAAARRDRAAAAAERRTASGTRTGRAAMPCASAKRIVCSISVSSCVAIATWPSARQHPLGEPCVHRVDVGLARVREVGRLEVRALDEAEVRRERRAATRGPPASGRGTPAGRCRRCRGRRARRRR